MLLVNITHAQEKDAVDVKKFKIPKAIAADVNSPIKTPENNKNEKKRNPIVTIKNYKINWFDWMSFGGLAIN